ncbi:MAG TPA: YihY/virulence factor BrkB family protein [Flavisolibacter sp.]|nr:YihY/virulence factor BrkB family protein [Flavisolibacter sp.]
MKRIRSFWKALKMAGEGFIEDNAFKLSPSLSYYTIYALGPLFVIIISLAGIFFGNDAVEGRLYAQLNGLVGSQAALQIQDIIGNIQESKLGTVGAIVGGIVLFIGATGVFTEMQDSINFIWSVKAKPKKGWLKFLSNRLLSFSLILGMGFILLVSLLANTLLNLLSEKLMRLLPNYTVQLFNMINTVIIVIVICTLFTFIFKVLPDAIISWKDALVGATFTTMLFLLGKFLINYYIGTSNLGLTYGAAASVIIILTWVYYSALILYFGAEFTKMYALQSGSGIKPKDTAVFIIKREAKEIPNIQE